LELKSNKTQTLIMKKFIIAYVAMVALVSLSACSSTSGTSTASTTSGTNAAVQPQVPFPDNPGMRNLPTATPDLPHPVPGPN
jgi:maltose-binding protein MalE